MKEKTLCIKFLIFKLFLFSQKHQGNIFHLKVKEAGVYFCIIERHKLWSVWMIYNAIRLTMLGFFLSPELYKRPFFVWFHSVTFISLSAPTTFHLVNRSGTFYLTAEYVSLPSTPATTMYVSGTYKVTFQMICRQINWEVISPSVQGRQSQSGLRLRYWVLPLPVTTVASLQ